MANDGKYLNISSGVPTQETAISTSAGAGDASKIIKLDSSGKLDVTFMPVGTDVAAISVTASEALSAGDFINFHNSTGLKMRKADATTTGKEAHGFVLAAVSNGATGTAYLDGVNTGVTGRTVGARQFLGTTAGAAVETAPSGSGNMAQVLGVAYSATAVAFRPSVPILLA